MNDTEKLGIWGGRLWHREVTHKIKLIFKYTIFLLEVLYFYSDKGAGSVNKILFNSIKPVLVFTRKKVLYVGNKYKQINMNKQN